MLKQLLHMVRNHNYITHTVYSLYLSPDSESLFVSQVELFVSESFLKSLDDTLTELLEV